MAKIKFMPINVEFDVESNIKILAVANRNKIGLRFGCGACRCGTCAVRVIMDTSDAVLSPIGDSEKALLEKMNILDGESVRLSCQAKVLAGQVTVDMDFQDTYDADSE